MAEFNDTTSFLNKTNHIKNEHQRSLQSVEEKNYMSYSVLETSQNKLTIPSTGCIPSTNETKNTNNEDDCELIVNLTGLGNSEGSDHCSLSSLKGPETNSQLIFGGNFQFFQKNALISFNMLKNMYNHKQQPITLKHVNVLKKMMLSTVSPSNLKITLGFNSKILDPMGFYRNDKKPDLFTGENSESNQVCVDFKRGNSTDLSLLKVKQYNRINDLCLEQDSAQKHLKLFQGLSLGTSSIGLGSIETYDAARTVCSSQESNDHVIQFYDPTITSRCINSISNITFSNENKVNRGYKLDNTFVGQLLPSINVGTHVNMLDSQVINNIPALSGNVCGENNTDCNGVVNICISEHTSRERSNDFTKNNQPLPNDFFDFNRIDCFAEISKKCTYPISKIKVYAEIDTTNSPLKIFHTLLNHEGDSNSSVVSNFKRNFNLASTNTEHENTLGQEMFCTNMEDISAKMMYNQSQTFQHEHDKSAISNLNLGHDLNGEIDVLSKNINSKSENFKEQDLSDINRNVSDEFDSNNSSPLNISIKEEVANAMSVLNANLENDKFEINKGEPLNRIWNDSEIDEAINDSIEKYVTTTTDKCILATPSISEKMCQTDISSFNKNSCKRILKFDDDDGGPLKKSKLPYKTEQSKDFSTSAELFSAEGIQIAEELLNTEEFEIMNNKEICWSPKMPSENRMMPVIYQEEENDTNEVNDDKSLFDEEEMEDGRPTWSRSTSESEAIDWDQLVPLPHQQIKSDKMEEGKEYFLYLTYILANSFM